MKHLLLALFLFVGTNSWAQISTTRMGDIYLGSTKAEVEKKIGQKIKLTKDTDEYSYGYYTYVNQKGVRYKLHFVDYSLDEKGEDTFMLIEIATESQQIKTLSGMGVGNSMEDLWKTYKHLNIRVWDFYTPNDKKERVFEINDFDHASSLFFVFRNEKVYKIRLIINEGC